MLSCFEKRYLLCSAAEVVHTFVVTRLMFSIKIPHCFARLHKIQIKIFFKLPQHLQLKSVLVRQSYAPLKGGTLKDKLKSFDSKECFVYILTLGRFTAASSELLLVSGPLVAWSQRRKTPYPSHA